jgi:hypothetical protein
MPIISHVVLVVYGVNRFTNRLIAASKAPSVHRCRSFIRQQQCTRKVGVFGTVFSAGIIKSVLSGDNSNIGIIRPAFIASGRERS